MTMSRSACLGLILSLHAACIGEIDDAAPDDLGADPQLIAAPTSSPHPWIHHYLQLGVDRGTFRTRWEGSVKGDAYEIPAGAYEQRLIDAQAFVGGAMGTRGAGDAMTLSWLPPRDDGYCNGCPDIKAWGQKYFGIYAGPNGRRDHILYQDWPMYGLKQILTRTAFRARTPSDITWQLYGGTQDFNRYGHGSPAPYTSDWKLCFGGLRFWQLGTGAATACTAPGQANDTSFADPLVRRALWVPAYRYADHRSYFSWLLWDFPSGVGHPYWAARKSQFSSRLPVALTADGQRSSLGFMHGAQMGTTTINHWTGFSLWSLPGQSGACDQNLAGLHFTRPRAFLITGVPYYDAQGYWGFRGGLGGLAADRSGDVADVRGNERLDILVVVKEAASFGPNWMNGRSDDGELPTDYLGRVLAQAGGGKSTEVYAFAIDPRRPTRSFFLGSMNRSDPDCDGASGSGCDGRYDDDRAGATWRVGFFHRRPDRALWAGEVQPADATTYHALPCDL